MQSQWLFPTPTNAWDGTQLFYPLVVQGQLTGTTLNDCGCNSPFKNDTGGGLSAAELLKKREDYKSETEAKCKEQHPVAVKFPSCKGARKPYCDCVNDSMSNYDRTVEEDIKYQRKQAQDAPFNEALDTLNQPGTLTSSASGGSSDIMLYGGLAIVFLALFYFGYRWYQTRQTTVPVQTPQA